MDPIEDLNKIGYKTLRTLGEGTYGKVVLAEDKVQRKWAIKIIDKKNSPGEYIAKYFPTELAILRKVRHPHIVEVHKIIRRYRFVYLFMDPAANDLNEKIWRCGPIPPALSKKWFSQLVSAVAYLHKHDIVHRDIKSSNVLLTQDEQVKLTDFSFSGFYRGGKKSEMFLCTTAYAAPEVLKEEPHDPKKSDVYSLGVTLYKMVTGSLPPKDASKALEFPPEVNKSCRTFILSMLQSDTEARPTAEELQQHPWLQTT